MIILFIFEFKEKPSKIKHFAAVKFFKYLRRFQMPLLKAPKEAPQMTNMKIL